MTSASTMSEGVSSWVSLPFVSTTRAQLDIVQSTLNFIIEFGFEQGSNMSSDYTKISGKPKLVTFDLEKNGVSNILEVPIITLVNFPSMLIEEVDVEFEIKVSSTVSQDGQTVVKGNLKSSNSAENAPSYKILAKAKDQGPSDGWKAIIKYLDSLYVPTGQTVETA